MAARQDFYLSIDSAASLTLDATCAARAAGRKPLPESHRRQLTSAVRSLERAQQTFFNLRNDPWQSQNRPKPKQMALPLST